ncbi:HD family phosphohydrolase [Thermovibrio ammonificans]|uniref:Metal dependent phosphohydrolase n=1 Tax=Thermovibrio ammonificans (strain DSM 15698 / JCM 12110 / HB-1) TaxID=648996 RepID=E8T6E5_THEA1|nr:HDIG domain-containing metalloprotein [Thermovibrio ammonificans]ADU96729.1 metal dependent phosphohydrolase [Thermovibrio ammonificans HB-1]
MKSLKQEKRDSLFKYGLVLLASVIVTFLLLPFSFVNVPALKPGQVSPVDVRSPVSAVLVDKEATERAREEAVKRVLPRVKYTPESFTKALKEVEGLQLLNKHQKELLKGIITSYYQRGIISEVPKGYSQVEVEKGGKLKQMPLNAFLSQKQAEELFKEDVEKLLGKKVAREVVGKVHLSPNFVFNKTETEKLWEKARSSVKPVLVEVQKGEVIVKKGEKVTPEAAEKLKLLQEAKSKGKSLNKYISIFLLTLLLYYSVLRLYRIISPSAAEFKNILFSLSAITLDIFLIKLFTYLAKLIVESLNLPVNESLIYVPVVTSVVFASMFINKKVAVLHSIPVALLSGFNLSRPELLIIPVIVGSVFAAFDSRKFKSREVIYKSALKGMVVTALAQSLLYIYYFGFAVKVQLPVQLALTAIGAVITAVVVNGLSPLIINLFNFTTDIVYMELINLNHPLLRKLILKAPGTYSHSVMVATLAEAAAEAIGANALLAKAGGLFHDIGKLKNPQAFIENQTGVNIHDKLPPEKSAAILRSHVEYGEELGRKYKLPEKVIEIIRQHHGTKLMKYFYHKAKELYGNKVNEKIYRYPGPKPQFKESGIVMMADTVEAAVRSMKDKELDLGKVIHKLIMELVEEGQLNQSGLSLKDISLIEKVFKKVLSGIYHNRIEYPDDENGKGSDKGDRVRS